MIDTSSDWVDLKSICEHFHVSPSTISRWEKLGLPRRKLGKVVRYSVPQCDKWFKKMSGGSCK